MAYIKALSYYLPDKVSSTSDLYDLLGKEYVDKVAKQVGVGFRHISSKNQTSSDLAVCAAEKMFEEYKIEREIIDYVIFCTQTPDYLMPSTSCILQDRLKLSHNCGTTGIDLGCSGFVYGLAIAQSFVKAGLAKNVLFLTADTISKVLSETSESRLLFGDGAAACLISDEGFCKIGSEFVLGSDGSGYKDLILENSGMRNYYAEKDPDDPKNYMYMNGENIFNFTAKTVPPLVDSTLEKYGFTKEDVDLFVFHQANKFMLNTVRKVCGISKDKFYIDLENYGNTTSSTIPIALKDAMDKQIIKPGSKVMIAGFGIGLSWAGGILKF
ncbi:MAG: ketoacyl-ACP synthase III [Bacteroidales bacterium]|nr:ketoacyl-ACP synthase III [Bacteroidales bacterium]